MKQSNSAVRSVLATQAIDLAIDQAIDQALNLAIDQASIKYRLNVCIPW